uniref:Uncharacterized protein n=1 Tax=Hygrophorus russula TaxID=264141 RepID=A0A346LZL7_9AGAR|nr:hypothetical protein [Hygrophorus russula]AXQ02212.1 hypothetical protein [Hygrophorus russula]
MKTNLKNYLLGTDLKYENIIGAVLAFNKKIIHNETFKSYDYFSFILFIDFRTVRIERYLINSSNPNIKTIDGKEDLFFTFNNKSYRIFHEDECSISTFNLNEINDGKLTRKFYFTFMLDLIRDYLYYETSYNNPNIASLRKLTTPKISATKINIDKNELFKPALGTGKQEYSEKKSIFFSQDYKLKDFEEIYPKKFINDFKLDIDTKNKEYTIFIPKHFNNLNLNQYFNKFNINLIDINRNELPQLVKDLIRTLNIKNIQNAQDLAKRIKIFNYNIVKN